MSETCNPCEPRLPVIVSGEDKTLTVSLTSQMNGLPVDITNATEIIAAFLNDDGTTLEKKLSQSQIVIVSGPGGAFQVLLTPTDTGGLKTSIQSMVISLTIGGKVTIINLQNSINVEPTLIALP